MDQQVETSENSFQTSGFLADAMPQIVFIAGANGSIEYLNRRWTDYTGHAFDRFQTESFCWSDFLHAKDRDFCRQSWQNSLTTGEGFQVEFRIRRSDGSFRWHLGRAVPLLRDEKQRVLKWCGTFTDIDDQKRAEEAHRFLAEVTRTLGSSFDYQSVVSKVTRQAVPPLADFCLVELIDNTTLRPVSFAHVSPEMESFVHKHYEPLSFHPDDPVPIARVIGTRVPVHIADVDRWVASGGCGLRLRNVITDLSLKSIMIVPIEAKGSVLGAITLATGTRESQRRYGISDLYLAQKFAGVIGMAIENARLYQAEKQLREELATLSGRLVSAMEEERIRLSREIHDELGQSLTVLKMELFQIKEKLPGNAKNLGQEVGSMVSMIDRTIQSMRRISAELRPIVLEDLGLHAAVDWLVKNFKARTGIDCRLSWHLAEVDPDKEVSIALYRILQESLTNAARHANTKRIEVSFDLEASEILLQVRDYGQGLGEGFAKSGKSSVGVIGMRERARGVGGAFSIESIETGGTRVTARLPAHTSRPKYPQDLL